MYELHRSADVWWQRLTNLSNWRSWQLYPTLLSLYSSSLEFSCVKLLLGDHRISKESNWVNERLEYSSAVYTLHVSAAHRANPSKRLINSRWTRKEQRLTGWNYSTTTLGSRRSKQLAMQCSVVKPQGSAERDSRRLQSPERSACTADDRCPPSNATSRLGLPITTTSVALSTALDTDAVSGQLADRDGAPYKLMENRRTTPLRWQTDMVDSCYDCSHVAW